MNTPVDTITRARQQRRQASPAERALWEALRRGQLGVRFRRQHPDGENILDFYCPQFRLAIQIERTVPTSPRYGHHRVLRFTPDEVLQELPRVLTQIRATMTV